MNFHEFQVHRAALVAADPTLVDFGETNIWRSLSDLIPRIPETPASKLHRCHLAQAWLQLFGLPAEWAQQAQVSSGVRNSLMLLFSVARQRGITLRIPIDVYPVYGDLAEAAGLSFETFPTLPELRLPSTGDWLLIPNPLKPAGRFLTSAEVANLRDWLKVNRTRRVLIDAVYTFDCRFHQTTQSLMETGQAIPLHSLSKGWLHPQVFGMALIPEADLTTIAPLFRENSPSQDNLRKASCLLRSHTDCPANVAKALSTRRDRASKIVKEWGLKTVHPQDVEVAGSSVDWSQCITRKAQRVGDSAVGVWITPR